MTFTTIASGSSGNSYILEDQGRKLLVEAGIQMFKIQQALKFQISGLCGCLISHEHGDHSKSVKDLMRRAVDCYMSEATAIARGVERDYRFHPLKDRVLQQVGPFKVLPFDVPHDVPTFGFMIEGPSGKKLFFATDAGFLPVKPDGCHILAVEANFDLDIMKGNNLHSSRQTRTYKGHHDIKRLENWFDQMIEGGHLNSVERIILLHLSSSNADAADFKERIQRKTGKITTIAGQPTGPTY